MSDQVQMVDRKEQARAKARQVLRESRSFLGLPLADQQSIYFDLVQEYMGPKPNGNGKALARPFATDASRSASFLRFIRHLSQL